MGRRRTRHKNLPERMYLDGPTYYWRGYVDGKQRRVPIGKTYAESIVEYGKLEARKTEPEQTLETLIRRFLADKRKPRAKATQKNYEIWGRQLVAIFPGFKPHQIQGHHAARIIDEHPKRVTGQRLVGLLSNVLSYAIRIGWMPGPNPLYGFDKGPKAKRDRYITDAEWRSILASSPPWLALFLRMAYLTALRKSDLLAMRWANVRDDGVKVEIKKTRKTIGVLVFDRGPEMESILAGLKDLRRRVVGLHVFSTRHGKPYDYSTVMRNYKAAGEAAGVADVTLHDIRRKRLTDIERAHGLQLAQRIAAHTDPRTTADYIVDRETRVSLPSAANSAHI